MDESTFHETTAGEQSFAAQTLGAAAERAQAVDVTAGSGEQPSDLRFFLPQGPPLPPKQWQRNWKVGIRIGSVVVAVLFLLIAVVAVVVGLISASTFTASGVVEVSCATRSVPSQPGIHDGARVTLLDASSGEVYGTTTLSDFTVLGSGICLLGFKIDDVAVADLYTVRIGTTFEHLASVDTLRGGALIS